MSEVRYISLSQIRSNPYQPRVNFDQESLDDRKETESGPV